MTQDQTRALVERLRDRLQRDRRGNFDSELSIRIGPGIYEEIMEAAAEIERLTRELELLGKMAAPVDMVRWTEAIQNIQSAADDYRKRALAAESSLNAAVESEREACAKVAEMAMLSFTDLSKSPVVSGSSQAIETALICAKAMRETASAIRSRAAGGNET